MYQKTLGLDGIEYDSASESRIADWLYLNDVAYEPHKKLPKPSRGFCDFYLTEYSLWVEYDGLMEVRTNDKLDRKKEFYEKHEMQFLIITRDNWELDLIEAIEIG